MQSNVQYAICSVDCNGSQVSFGWDNPFQTSLIESVFFHKQINAKSVNLTLFAIDHLIWLYYFEYK